MSAVESSSLKSLSLSDQKRDCSQCKNLKFASGFVDESVDVCKDCMRYNSATPCSSCPTRWLPTTRPYFKIKIKAYENSSSSCMECIILHSTQISCHACDFPKQRNPNNRNTIPVHNNLTCYCCIILRYIHLGIASADILDPSFCDLSFTRDVNDGLSISINSRPCHSCADALPFYCPFTLCRNCIYLRYGHLDPVKLPVYLPKTLLDYSRNRSSLIRCAKYFLGMRGRFSWRPITYITNDTEKAIIASISKSQRDSIVEHLIPDIANLVIQALYDSA